MNRIILVPSIFLSEDVVSDRWRLLIWMLRDKLGFKIVTINKDIPKDVKTAMIIGLPRHIIGRSTFPGNESTRLIVYTADVHKTIDPGYKEKVRRLLERCDVHLSAGDAFFRDAWPEYTEKHVFFPYFFASQERYKSLEFNNTPIMKCLFTGHHSKAYGFRRGIYCFAKSKVQGSELFTILEHPGNLNAKKNKDIVGQGYANILNRHYCSITSTLYGYPLAKHFEIMASGSLLLSDETEDLTTLGMIAGQHYVSITVKNYKEKVRDCLENPEKYNEIRKHGMEFSRRRHGIDSRFDVIKKIVKRLERKP